MIKASSVSLRIAMTEATFIKPEDLHETILLLLSRE